METSNTCNIKDTSEGLPSRPEEPLSSDCCGSGCTPCVYDIYEEDLKRWERECKSVNQTKWIQSEASGALSRSEFRIESISKMTGNCWLYRFGIAGGGMLGLKTGQHLILRY